MVVIVLVIVAVLIFSFPAAGIKSNKEDSSTVRSGETSISETVEVDSTQYSIVDKAQDFQQDVHTAGHYQANGWGDQCLGFSMAYADSIVTGDYSKGKSVVSNSPSGLSHYGYSGRKLFSNKQDMLQEAYSELSAGRPVIIHINGNSAGTSRHYSPAIGFKKTTDPSNVQETDLLILDVWDAKIESLNGKGSGTRFITSGRDCGWEYDYELYKYF